MNGNNNNIAIDEKRISKNLIRKKVVVLFFI